VRGMRYDSNKTEPSKQMPPEIEFLNGILVELSGHKLESSQTSFLLSFFRSTKCFS
jgi:hypothetical protein